MAERRRILSEAQLNEACELRERGWSCRRIADHFARNGTAVSEGAISWHCLRLGADTPSHRRSAPPDRLRAVARRGNHLVRPFTPDEDSAIRRLSLAGLGPHQIGRRLDPPRKCNSVLGRLMTLARHEAREEEMAHG